MATSSLLDTHRLAYQAMRLHVRLINEWELAESSIDHRKRIGRILNRSTRRIERSLNRVQILHERNNVYEFSIQNDV